jgi:glycogen debranching enzyme
MLRFLARSGAAAVLASTSLTGQTIPSFDLGQSPLTLHGEARAGAYLASVGRRAIAMGTEDGRFELWSWPLKWLHDFQLEFRVPKYTQPIPARDVARHVTVRPEGVTIEYSYETFTVKQTVFSALDAPAVFMLLEVDAIRPLEIVATFRPDIHYAWPASLGGQYISWNPGARAFLFSESRRQVNAFLGSPAVTRASDVPAHMLTASPPQFTIGVGDRSQQYTEPRLGEPPGGNINLHEAFIPIVMAGGEMPRDSARALYDRMLAPGAARAEWARRVAHYARLRETTLRVTTPSALLNGAFEWAKVNLDESMACNPDLGCGLVAGYGLSGSASDRPGFGWFFGGDAAINSFAMTAAGQRDLVRDGVFRFFAKYQRADGKITHEISQGAAKIDWFRAFPYAFYHGDTTPFWVLAFGEYWKQTADTALVRELWPNVRKAYEWSKTADSDGDGLMENPIAGAGALEVGDLQVGIVSDVYLAGVWVAALERFARMAEAMREPAIAAEARVIRGKALRTMEQRLWLPQAGQYAFALLEGGKVNENLTAWPATAMAFDVFDATNGAQMASRLAGADIMTDWGARPLSARSSLFDPLHYNNGAVWPFVTGWVALAQYRYHNAHAGLFALEAIANTGFAEALGRNPEVISGRLFKPLDTAVPHQFFATSMVITPLVRGLLGLDVDAPAGRVTIAPRIPADWDSLRVDQIAVGEDRLSLVFRRRRGAITAEVWRTAGDAGRPVEVTFAPALPLGATNVQSMVPGAGSVQQLPGAVVQASTARLRERLRLGTSWDGGVEVVSVSEPPRIGARSRALRIISERIVGGRHVLVIQGRARHGYQLRLRAPTAIERITVEPAAASVSPLTLGEADPKGWQTLQFTMPAEGEDDDGYVTVSLVIG